MSSPLPSALLIRLKGSTLATSGVENDEGLSVVGAKIAVFTDHPGVYVHDTGGMFGSQVVLSVQGAELADPARFDLRWAARSTTLLARMRPNPGHRVRIALRGNDAEKVELAWAPVSGVGEHRRAAKLSVVPTWSAERAGILARLTRALQGAGVAEYEWAVEVGDGSRSDSPISEDCLALLGRIPDDDVATRLLGEWLATGEVALHAAVLAGRLVLHTGDPASPVASVPAGSLDARIALRSVFIQSALLMAGEHVTAIELVFPQQAEAAVFFAALQKTRAANPAASARPRGGLVAAVVIRGLLAGNRAVHTRCDIAHDRGALEVLDPKSGKPVCRFDLGAPSALLAASGGKLVVANDEAGPLVVTYDASAFREALFADPTARATARRTAEAGPQLALLKDDCAVKLFVSGENIAFVGARAPAPMPAAAITGFDVILDPTWPCVTLLNQGASLTIAATHDQLEAILAKVVGAIVAPRTSVQPEQFVEALLGLERAWAAHVVFAPVLDLHLHLLRARGPASSAGVGVLSSVSPSDPAQQSDLVMGFASGVPLLRRHLDDVAWRLPRVLVQRDAVFLASALGVVPPALREHEGRYSAAFGALGPVGRQVERVEREVVRVDSARRALARAAPGVGGLVISLGASALHPMFLLGAMQQAYALTQAGGNVRASEAEKLADAASTAAREWDYLLRALLPAVSERVLGQFLTTRAEFYRSVIAAWSSADAEKRARISHVLARRFGRLDAILRLPADPTSTTIRGAHVERLRELAAAMPEPAFPSF